MEKLEIIIIGAGMYVCGKGTTGHGTILPAIYESKRLNENIGNVHCVSTSLESSQNLLKKSDELGKKTGVALDIKAYPDSEEKNHIAYKEILKNLKRPACAIIAVPDHLHYQIAKDCLESGIHVLMVKPLTPTYAEGAELTKIASKSNLHAAVEFHKRWDKSNLILRDKFKSGELGTPLNCWVEYSQRKSIPISSFKEWASNTSILQYLGVHYIDIIRFITGAVPIQVMAIGQKSEIVKHGVDTYDSIQCMVKWKLSDRTEFSQTLLTSWVDPESSTAMSDQKIKFIGTRGRYEADQKERGIRVNTDKFGVEHINPDFCMPYGDKEGNIRWRGYGIESITTFINDVLSLNKKSINLSSLRNKRPSFKESLISTAVVEAAHTSLDNDSTWQTINKRYDF